jgi:hypothetical protein
VTGRARRLAAAVTLAVAVALVGACSGPGVIKVKDPGKVPDLTTTTAIDFGQIALKGVSSRTTSTIGVGPGGANVSGTVTGPDGPVAGATVHVERLVGNAGAASDIVTAADGTWAAPAVLGGRYRVRTWRAPDLALTKPELFYLQSSENKTLNLRVDRYTGIGAAASIAPSPPVQGEPANLFVLLTAKSVDATGVVRAVPVPATNVELSGSGYSLESANPEVTDANGVAEWHVRCQTTSPTQLSITTTDASVPLNLPACVESTASPPPETTTTFRRTTPTTRSRGD